LDDQLLDFTRARWNRMLMNGFWCLLGLMMLFEFLYLAYITPLAPGVFFKKYILLPTALHLIVLIGAELAIRYLSEKIRDYALLIASALMTFIIAEINIEVNYIIMALFLPVLVSTFYFSAKKLLFAFLLCLIALFSMYFFNPYLDISLIGILSITAMMGAFSLVAWGVITRGKELRQYYIHTSRFNQELMVKNTIMDKLAKTDSLTELYNHITFHEYLDKLIDHHEASGMPLQLALIDIDDFKSVNDQFGHRAGDLVLKKVSEIVQAQAGMNDFVARYGGEELAVIFTDRAFDKSLHILEAMQSKISSAVYEKLGTRRITVSIGFSDYADEGKENFFARTDKALYSAKSSGKNRIIIADSSDHKPASLS
jgi:diguanylate cyclase (GGDEF)-like protein